MELFKPSKKILENICGNEDFKDLLYKYEVYPRGDGKFNEDIWGLFITSLYIQIANFYKFSYKKDYMDFLNCQKIADVSSEAFKNCYDHGPKDKNIITGLFLGNKGICYGFCDGGNYFKNEKIKYQYENKIEVTEFDSKTLKNNINDQCGVNEFIYPNSDLIEVDSEKGVLYCVQLKENIVGG